ncbi:MAG: STAS domain-containing protein [Opitutaceae bacterium]|nr:STAS domain-containing protein [Opitutaceae bacterium]
MLESHNSVYLADVSADPVAIRIEGRASFQNSACLQDFVKALIDQGRYRFTIDFGGCTGMDSTFLGVLAGAALQVRKHAPPGSLTLLRIEGRNLELVRNLGLHRILNIEEAEGTTQSATAAQAIPCVDRSELEQAKVALQAHENLVEAEEGNRGKFQDVLHFLRKRIDEEKP